MITVMNNHGAGGTHPTDTLSLPGPSPVSGPPVPFFVFDVETHGGIKSRVRDEFIRTSQFVCAASYDSETNWVYHYGPTQLELLVQHLEEAAVVVSFNGKGYDIPVIENLIGRPLVLKQHIDLFEMIVAVTGDLKGYGLEAVAKTTLGRGKLGKGVWASELYERALKGGEDGAAALFELVGYCGGDVRLTRDLLLFVREYSYILSPKGIVNLILPDVIKRLA